MAALGSAVGVFLLDGVCRRGGEEGLKKTLHPKRFVYLKKARAGWAVAPARIAPPPFPFTAVIAAASTFEIPSQEAARHRVPHARLALFAGRRRGAAHA